MTVISGWPGWMTCPTSTVSLADDPAHRRLEGGVLNIQLRLLHGGLCCSTRASAEAARACWAATLLAARFAPSAVAPSPVQPRHAPASAGLARPRCRPGLPAPANAPSPTPRGRHRPPRLPRRTASARSRPWRAPPLCSASTSFAVFTALASVRAAAPAPSPAARWRLQCSAGRYRCPPPHARRHRVPWTRHPSPPLT